jgi:hypothetical protein
MMLGNTTAISYWVNWGSEHLWRIVYIYYLNPTSIVADECLWTVQWLHSLRSMYLLVSFWGKMSSAKDERCTHWDTDKRSGLYLLYDSWIQYLCFDRSSLFLWIHVVFYFQRIHINIVMYLIPCIFVAQYIGYNGVINSHIFFHRLLRIEPARSICRNI